MPRHTVPVTLATVESALRIVARAVQHDRTYLPLFERLIEERTRLVDEARTMVLVERWAQGGDPAVVHRAGDAAA